MANWLPSSLRGRITVGFTVLVLTFAGLSVYAVLTIEGLSKAIRITHAGYVKLALVSADLDSKQSTLKSYLREELGEEYSPRWARKRLQRLLDSRQRLLEQAESILTEARQLDGVRANQFATSQSLVERMRKLLNQAQQDYELILSNPPIAGSPIGEERDHMLTILKRLQLLETRIGQLSDELKLRESTMVAALSGRLDIVSRKAWVFTMIFGVVAVIVGILMTLGAVLLLRPLGRLREAAGQIARGDYQHRIDVSGPSEVAELASEFNVMAAAIEDRSRELVRTERLASAGKMAAMITHEVRNPLSSIGLNTELLEEEFAELPNGRGDEAQALCQSITKEIDRLTEITEEYLQLTRLPTPDLIEQSLYKVVESTVNFVREQMLAQGIAIKFSGDDQRRIPLDEDKIRQAVLNLIRNAAEAVAEKTDASISISVSEERDFTELIVSDNGGGIPEEVLEKLFEAFVSTKSSGTGLGLALTQQIVRDHGGSIGAKNREEGGAEFTIRFPFQLQ